MFVSTYAGAVAGIDAVKVTVEVNLTGGGLGLYLVGLPDNAVKESEQRIRAAFENTGRKMSGRKVVVNLAPADLRKEGAGFDLPIAVGILAAMSEVSGELLPTTMFADELSLDGTLRPVRGVLPLAVKARDEGLRRLVVPAENAAEAAVVEGVEVYGLHSLGEVIALLNGERRFDATVPVDAEGLVVDRLPTSARLVYVTPSHQFPTGGTLSAARRAALLEWAARCGAVIVEDDGCGFDTAAVADKGVGLSGLVSEVKAAAGLPSRPTRYL